MNKLSKSITKAVENKIWQPIKLTRNGTGLSHLFFADDILLFNEATPSQAHVINIILLSFASKSSLKVNLHKSRASASATVPRRVQLDFKSSTGIQFIQYFGSYLGFPIIKGRMKKDHFLPALERKHSKLDSWSTKFLNKAGRVTSAKAV